MGRSLNGMAKLEYRRFQKKEATQGPFTCQNGHYGPDLNELIFRSITALKLRNIFASY